MKLLFLEDHIFNRETLDTPANRRKLAALGTTDWFFARDTNGERFSTPAEFVGKLERQGPEGWITIDPETARHLPGTDILLVHTSGVTAEMMDLAGTLKLILCFRSGADGINLQAAKERGIPVCNCPSRLGDPVADMTLALMLSECRGLTRCELQHLHGRWKPDDIRDASNAALCNLTVGLVGYGGIARKVAKRLIHGFGSRVLAYDPFTPADSIQADGAEAVSLQELLKSSDIVSLHVCLTEETRGMFGREQFEQMKQTAIFINTARGALVDEPALIDALKNGTIRSAGLDVFAREPLPQDSELLTLPNVTLTPHMSGVTTDIVPNTLEIARQELERFVQGKPLRFQVNR